MEFLLIVMGYGIGLLQSAYIVGRMAGKIDIRDHGSGNAGMTNVMRVMGAKAGIFVLLLDVSKAVLAVMLANLIFHGRPFGMTGIEYFPGLLAGLGVILGHNFPFYLKFKGGKGVASSLGVVIMFDWRVLVIALGVGLIVLIITKYMSLGSLLAFLTLGTTTTILFDQIAVIAVMWLICALPFYTHRHNIVRLAKGSENKFTLKRKTNSS